MAKMGARPVSPDRFHSRIPRRRPGVSRREFLHCSGTTALALGAIAALSKKAQHPIRAHLYLDTGLGRMGMPYHRALPWIAELAARKDLVVAGTFMAFTEETDFDREQLLRFRHLVEQAQARGINLGRLHAASSNGVFHLPGARLDAVRPGIALYGGYPSRPEEERSKAELRPALRLRAGVVRVERLRPGDSASASPF